VQERVGGFVAEVFLQPIAHEGVDDALRPLGQEEGAPGGKLGIIELEEVRETLAIVQDVDLDRRLLGVDMDAQVRLDVAFQHTEAADGR
jgi:hypothetical protein